MHRAGGVGGTAIFGLWKLSASLMSSNPRWSSPLSLNSYGGDLTILCRNSIHTLHCPPIISSHEWLAHHHPACRPLLTIALSTPETGRPRQTWCMYNDVYCGRIPVDRTCDIAPYLGRAFMVLRPAALVEANSNPHSRVLASSPRYQLERGESGAGS